MERISTKTPPKQGRNGAEINRQAVDMPKAFTSRGVAVARFSMVVIFKEKFRRTNPKTGEIFESWTYRGDVELAKLEMRGIVSKSQLDSLGLIYKKFKERFLSVRIYDNSKPANLQLIVEAIDTKIIYPETAERIQNFHKWLNSI